MLTNSRAVATASAIAADRASVALVSLVRGEGTRSSTRASGCESGPGAVMDDLNSVKLYAPNAKSLGGCAEIEDRERGCDGVDAGQ